MTKTICSVSVDEFIQRILNGERDFTEIEFKDGSDLEFCEGFKEMQTYLQGQESNLRGSPVILNGSKLRGVRASGLYLPFVRGIGIDISGGHFTRANFFNGYLKKANCNETDLTNSDLAEADLRCSDLRNADLYLANCWKTEFAQADLRGARNLEKAKHVGDAHYHQSKVTSMEEKIIREAVMGRNLFNVVN